MIVWVKTVPRRLKTAAHFVAPDPWNGGAATEQSLEECVYVPVNLDVDSPRALKAMGSGRVFFLRSDLDGSERLLPEALVELWQTGKVPVEWLPQLLFERPGKVRPRHAVPILHRRLGRWLVPSLVAGVLGAGTYIVCRGWLEQGRAAGTIDTTRMGPISILAVIGFMLGLVGLSVSLGLMLAAPILALRKRSRRREMATILERLGVPHG